MIEEPKPVSILRPVRRPNAEQVADFQNVPTGFVVDAMYGRGALAPDITPLGAGMSKDIQIAGPALTVDNRPSDVLALLHALPFIQPGDIVVNAVAGFQGCAAAGDRVSGMMKNCGASGFVTDGPMRDFEGLSKVALPSWCSGLNPGSPFATGPGRIGTAVILGGQRVETGDMVVADRDGVVVVPFAEIDAVRARLKDVAALEAELDKKVEDGLDVPDDIKTAQKGADVTWLRQN